MNINLKKDVATIFDLMQIKCLLQNNQMIDLIKVEPHMPDLLFMG